MPEYNIGDIIDSRYQLKKLLGGGRVGKVYLARDQQQEQDVAIKLLTDRLNSEKEQASFLREFDAVKNLKHPGVVKVYEQGPGYFTMEYVDGDSLSKLKECDVSQIFDLGIDITRVLEYIHRQGVIHRDLKPDNIKITPFGQVKIMDFGFAIGHNVTNLITSGQHNIAGTLNYMAPEVIKGFEVDPRADLYTLGIILYELVTGTLPFKSSDLLTTVVKQIEMNPPMPSELNPKVTPGFESIIIKLIAKSPSKRFQSADELLSAMMRLAGRSEILKIKIDKGRKFLYPAKFCGREKELELLKNSFQKSMRGRSSFVLIQGDEGYGKSRIINEFKAQNATEGIIFLDVICDSSMSDDFSPFPQLIYEAFNTLEKIDISYLTGLVEKWGELLLPIVPSLMHKSYMHGIEPKTEGKQNIQGIASKTEGKQNTQDIVTENDEQNRQGNVPKTENDEQNMHGIEPKTNIQGEQNMQEMESKTDLQGKQIIQHLCQFFVEVSRQYALGIFLDDLDWLGTHNTLLLLQLIEASQDHSIFICGTYKSNANTDENTIERILPRLHNRKLCEKISLVPLTLEETNQMIGSMIGKESFKQVLTERIYEITRGIPLLAEETMKILADDGLIYRRGGVWIIDIDDVRKIRRPNVLEEVLLKKYEELDNNDQKILQIATVFRRKFDISLLEKIYESPDDNLQTRIQNLISSRFLMGRETKIQIVSPQLAELIYEKITPKNQQKFHAKIAHQLEQILTYEHKVEELAHHYLHANQKHKAMQYLIAAGEQFEAEYAYESCIKFYKKALEISKEKKLSENTLLMYEKLGHIYYLSGQHDIALEYYLEGLQKAKEQNKSEEEFNKGLGLCYYNKGNFNESKKYFQILLDSLRKQKCNMVKELNLAADIHIAIGEHEEAEKLLREAVEYSHEGNKELLVSIYSSLAKLNFMRGYWGNAQIYYAKALDYLHHSRDYRLKAKISLGTAQVYLHQGRTLEAYKYMEDALYFCHLTSDREQRLMTEIDLGKLFEYQGQLIRAKAIYSECLELAQDLDMKQGRALSYLGLAKIHTLNENFMEALYDLRQGQALFQTLQLDLYMIECYLLLANIYFGQGEYENAEEQYGKAEETLIHVNIKWKLSAVYMGLASIYQKLGKLDRANKTLNKALRIAKKYDDSIMLGQIHTQYGLFCAEQNLHKEAIEHFVSAIVFLERTTCNLILAQSYYEYGRTLLQFERRGDHGFLKVALHQLEKAYDIFSKSGLTAMNNKAGLLIKECQREKSNDFYKRDLSKKVREIGRDIIELKRDSLQEIQDIRKQLQQEIEDNMDFAEVEKKLAELESKFNQQIEKLQTENSGLLEQVETLKEERESLLTLQKISNTINTVLDSQKLLNLIMDMVVRELRAERGFLVILENNDTFNYKAARNIDQEEMTHQDFILSKSIVTKVIKTGEPVLTSDAQADSRFQSESIIDLKLRSILCVPFKIKDQVIGAVYLDNRFVSGLFTEKNLDFLVAFSNQAAIAIENAFLYEEIREKERMEQEICIAARIQAGLLPKAIPKIPGLEVFGRMVPARQVGGDYYDFIQSSNNNILTLVIGDVAGKGVPAGLVMVMARLLLHHFLVDLEYTQRQTLISTNKILKDNTEPFVFMSLLLAQWDAQNHKFRYTGAGHENLLVCRFQDKKIEVIPAGGMVLGVRDDIELSLQEKEIELMPGDTIIFYTDGVTECVSSTGDMLELEGFLSMVQKYIGKAPRDLVSCLFNELIEYIGNSEQRDDITLTAIRKL
ncbi:MAG TPA: SpoIIE family protein phosphatase [Planctomycetota bacterium]|nr:SpoIIE family protein phosphatase [Planctomycetota bacterium]